MNQFRMQLVRTEQELGTLRSENAKLNEMVKLERSRTEIHEKKIGTMEFKIEEQIRKLRERENLIKELQTHNNQKQCAIKEMEMEQDRLRRKYQRKIDDETEKASRQMAREFKEREEMLNVSVLENGIHILANKQQKTFSNLFIIFNFRIVFEIKIGKFVKFVN